MKEYFYLTGKNQNGPISFEELLTKGLSGDTLIWSEGMGYWERLKDIPELMQVIKPFEVPPPPPKDIADEKLKIEIKDDLFLSPEELSDLSVLSFTGFLEFGDFVFPYLYIQNNEDMMIDRNLSGSGLPLIFISYTNKISFVLYSLKKKKLFKLFDVERENIKEFKVASDQKFQAIKFKDKRGAGINPIGLGSVLGTAVPIIGPIIGALFGFGYSKLKEKVTENHVYETTEINGSIFHLICNRGKKEFTISIACLPKYVIAFEQYLQKHWSVNIPTIPKK